MLSLYLLFLLIFFGISNERMNKSKETQRFHGRFFRHLTFRFDELSALPVGSEIPANTELYKKLIQIQTTGITHSVFDIMNYKFLASNLKSNNKKCKTKLDLNDLHSFQTEKKVRTINIYVEPLTMKMTKVFDKICDFEACALKIKNEFQFYHLNGVFNCY